MLRGLMALQDALTELVETVRRSNHRRGTMMKRKVRRMLRQSKNSLAKTRSEA